MDSGSSLTFSKDVTYSEALCNIS